MVAPASVGRRDRVARRVAGQQATCSPGETGMRQSGFVTGLGVHVGGARWLAVAAAAVLLGCGGGSSSSGEGGEGGHPVAGAAGRGGGSGGSLGGSAGTVSAG